MATAVKTNAHEDALLNAVFLKTYPTMFGGTYTADTAGSLYLSLHTADPGVGGTQLTSEVGYTSYTRVGVPPTGTNFALTSGVMENLNSTAFPSCTGGTATATHLAIGSASSGAGLLYYRTELQTALSIASSVTPTIDIDALKVLEE